MMNAIAGFNATIYVKFCSGPTPMYTRLAFAVLSKSGITYWSHASLERRLSERKVPSDSEKSVTSFQNS